MFFQALFIEILKCIYVPVLIHLKQKKLLESLSMRTVLK